MKWIKGAIVVAIGLALHLTFSLFLTPLVGTFYVIEPGHSMMVHAMRVAAVAFPALVLFAASGLARAGDSGRVVAAFSSLFLIGLCAWTVREEIVRLSALNPRADARALLRQADIALFCAVCFAGFVAFIAPVVSLVRVRRTTRGYNKPVRSKSAAHGDAEWAPMKLAGELFRRMARWCWASSTGPTSTPKANRGSSSPAIVRRGAPVGANP